MPSQPQMKQPADQSKQEYQDHSVAIGSQVMSVLGKPSNLHRVQVSHLWAEFYRINVFVGEETTAVKVAHSYFLAADRDGNIVTSNPAITKQYDT